MAVQFDNIKVGQWYTVLDAAPFEISFGDMTQSIPSQYVDMYVLVLGKNCPHILCTGNKYIDGGLYSGKIMLDTRKVTLSKVNANNLIVQTIIKDQTKLATQTRSIHDQLNSLFSGYQK